MWLACKCVFVYFIFKCSFIVISCVVIIDDFTRRSTLTIQYVSSSDQGTYLCTGQSSSLDKQSSVTKAFSLSVIGKIMLYTSSTVHVHVHVFQCQ